LLMVTVNRAELGLFNGDVGVVWPDDRGEPKVWFEVADDALRAISPAALPPHEGAFTDRAQGAGLRVRSRGAGDRAGFRRAVARTAVHRRDPRAFGDCAVFDARCPAGRHCAAYAALERPDRPPARSGGHLIAAARSQSHVHARL